MCEFQKLEISGRFLGYQVHLNLNVNWKCDLRVFISKRMEVLWSNPHVNDIPCVTGPIDRSPEDLSKMNDFFSNESVFKELN